MRKRERWEGGRRRKWGRWGDTFGGDLGEDVGAWSRHCGSEMRASDYACRICGNIEVRETGAIIDGES